MTPAKTGSFNDSSVNLNLLKKRAFNLRWATVSDGVIPLTAADPDFPCAPEISEAICRFAKEGYFSYGPPEGLPQFNESVADYFRDKRDIPASPDLVFPVDSAAFGLYLSIKTFLEPGKEAVIFDPVDFLFRRSIELAGGRALPFHTPPGNKAIDFERLEHLITKRTRLLCLCNPLNPTGKVFSKDELIRLGAIACKHNLTILSDEIWSDIIFSPNRFTSIASVDQEIRNRTITVTGFSKAYGLAGLRTGAVLAPNQELYSRLMQASLHHTTIHGPNILSQIAAVTALNKCETWLRNFLNHLEKMRTVCVEGLNGIPGFTCHEPEACYLAFANISGTGISSQEMYQLLLKSKKLWGVLVTNNSQKPIQAFLPNTRKKTMVWLSVLFLSPMLNLSGSCNMTLPYRTWQTERR